MEYFHKAKCVRLRSHHGKFLAADPDEETVKQKSSGSGAETRWMVEFVPGKPNLIRLKSSSSWKYLCAREETLMVGGWSGKKVVQGSARLKSDPAVEWEPIKEGVGNHVKLRSTWKGTFLKANGQMFWRNSVTHDESPNSTATQDWILWVVDVLEFDHGNEMDQQQIKDRPGQGGRAGSIQSQRAPPPSFTGVMDSIKRQNSDSDDISPRRSKLPPAGGVGGDVKSKLAQKPVPSQTQTTPAPPNPNPNPNPLYDDTPAAHQLQHQSNQNHHQPYSSLFSRPAAADDDGHNYTPKQEDIRPARNEPKVQQQQHHRRRQGQINMKNNNYIHVLDDWQKIYDNHDFTYIQQLPPVGVNNSSSTSSTPTQINIIPFEVQKANLTLKEIDIHLSFKEAYYQGQLKQIEKAISTLLSYTTTTTNNNNNNIIIIKLKSYQDHILSLRTNHDTAFTTLDQYDTFSNKRSSMKAQIQEQANRARDLQSAQQDRLNALTLARDKRDDLLRQLRDLDRHIREEEIALKDDDRTLQEVCRSIEKNKDLYNLEIEKQQNNWLAKKVEAHDMIKRVENDWDQIKLDLSLHNMLIDRHR